MTIQEVELPQGTLRYQESGDGKPVVFVHGVFVNSALWRKVVPDIAAAGFRCLVPDWPFGSHELPMRPGAALDPVGCAELIADFLDALDLHDVTLVASDTGGALTQIMLARRPERVGRVVLLPSDCFESFFPPLFKPLVTIARIPGALTALARLVRIRALWSSPFLFGLMLKHPVDPAVLDSYLRPLGNSAGVRRDVGKLLRGVDPRLTLDAAEKLRTFDKPVLLAWANEDRLFPIELAHRLAAVLPSARLVEIPDSYMFVSEDQPAVLVHHVLGFLADLGLCDAPSEIDLPAPGRP